MEYLLIYKKISANTNKPRAITRSYKTHTPIPPQKAILVQLGFTS